MSDALTQAGLDKAEAEAKKAAAEADKSWWEAKKSAIQAIAYIVGLIASLVTSAYTYFTSRQHQDLSDKRYLATKGVIEATRTDNQNQREAIRDLAVVIDDDSKGIPVSYAIPSASASASPGVGGGGATCFIYPPLSTSASAAPPVSKRPPPKIVGGGALDPDSILPPQHQHQHYRSSYG